MRRLSMKTKRSKYEISDSDSEENGDGHLTIADNNDEMKKGKENKNVESPRRGSAKKRLSRNRHNQKETTEDFNLKSDVKDTQDAEEENKNVGKAGPSKRLKKGDQKPSPLTKQDGNNEKEYEVERIVSQRTIKGRRQFLVRWKGYDEDSDTWEQEKDLNCLELIEEFLAENAENEEDNKSKKLENSPKSPKNKITKIDKKSKKLKTNIKKQTENGKQITSDEEKSVVKDDQKEFEVEKIIEVRFKKNKTKEFLIRWKGFTSADDTWEPEENLNCPELIAKFMQKVEKAKTTEARELRANRPHTKRYTLSTHEHGRRLSRRNIDKQRATYHECDE
ncbi:PREDICTED: chromo domain-containing protein cec-4-like [Eufriesea mexicana]|uniref:chromo domain-containing protein cec-4-like n=1 Tax=Eufriesea mexicana TaxID=516756 RepID=UPI00083C5568|nr:PREDICTED: chromo domain-containing protein cec-4-like [Eufriesea mexicana]XP_017754389.1 PREDICTED: chromo domain-containing protein cec-4-like [Eufriesea mexicana]